MLVCFLSITYYDRILAFWTTKKQKKKNNVLIWTFILFYWLIEQWAGKICKCTYEPLIKRLFHSLIAVLAFKGCVSRLKKRRRKNKRIRNWKIESNWSIILTIHVITFKIIDYKITHETVLMCMIEAVMCVKNAAACLYCFLCIYVNVSLSLCLFDK